MEWISALVGPLLIIIGGIISWFIKDKSEKLRLQEEKIKKEQEKIYNELLRPYLIILSDPKKVSEVEKIILSERYKENAFKMRFFGSDNMIEAHNELMRISYEAEKTGKQDSIKMMELMGKLFLAVRKDLGYPKTKLREKDMISFIIKDIDEYMK
jgi:hypothetical protein